MADYNQVHLMGRLTRDPELRMVPSGTNITQTGIAVNHKYKGQDGVMRDETMFIDVTFWGKLAETVSKYTKKGRLVFITGRIKLESWDDKQTGQKRNKHTIVADSIQFLDRMEGGAPASEESAGDEWSAPSIERPTAAKPPFSNPPFANVSPSKNSVDKEPGWEAPLTPRKTSPDKEPGWEAPLTPRKPLDKNSPEKDDNWEPPEMGDTPF